MRDTCVLFEQVTIIGRHEIYNHFKNKSCVEHSVKKYDDPSDKVRDRRVRDKGRHKSIFKMLHVPTQLRRKNIHIRGNDAYRLKNTQITGKRHNCDVIENGNNKAIMTSTYMKEKVTELTEITIDLSLCAVFQA